MARDIRAVGIGLVDELGSLTFSEMHRRSNALGRALTELGVTEGDSVALMCRNHRGFVDASVAVAKLGADLLYLNTAFAGPWGISYSANLTPDKNTGLGIWTEDMFLKAMKTGKHMGTSREIQPPMPWPWIGKATDEDLKAIFAYLQSIPPIVNHVPDYEPPAPAAPQKAAPKRKPAAKKKTEEAES